MRAYTSAQSKALDKAAQAQGIAGFELMRRAGMVAFQHIGRHFKQARSLLVCAGKGNNGGDAWIVAGAAHAAGWGVHLWQVVGTPADLRGEASQARDWAFAQGLETRLIDRTAALELLAKNSAGRADAMVLVDGVLGTGLSGPPRPGAADAIDCINASPCPCVSLDLPSGLDADNGAAPGALVKSDLTVTFIGMKLGLLTGKGPDCAGKWVLENLGVDVARLSEPGAVSSSRGARRVATAIKGCAVLSAPVDTLPARRPAAFKNEFGHVAVLAGDQGGGGAALLAAESALRTGAGLVSLGTRALHVAAGLARRPELMVRAVDDKAGALELLKGASVGLVGPGLGQGDWGRELYCAVLEHSSSLASTGASIDFVVDADALNLVASGQPLPARSVITPHPGEAGRLLGCDTKAIEADRVGAVCELAGRYSCIAVLKGAGTLIADSAGLQYVCALGNPGMASAGMGDTLAGIVAGVVAQQELSAFWVGRAVQLHAAAGDLAAARYSQPGMVAADVIAELPRLLGGDNAP